MIEVLALMAYALVMTVIVEVLLAVVLFGIRGRRGLVVVALAQAVTNPIVEFVCLASNWRPSLPLWSWPWVALLAVEVTAMVAEAVLYRVANVVRRPWLMSCVLNGISFGAGLLIAVAFH